MAVKFFFNEISIKVPERKKLKQNIEGLFKMEKRELSSLSYVFCTDKYLLNINNEFLGHDDYTDIITFTLSKPNEAIVGEVYISAERVKYNAKIVGVSINEELHRVIFHGALHLCGYKDKNPADKAQMTSAEDKYLEIHFN